MDSVEQQQPPQNNGEQSSAVEQQQQQQQSVYLMIVAGQTFSSDNLNFVQNLITSSLAQIGGPVLEHTEEILNAVRAQQFEQISVDQEYHFSFNNGTNFEFDLLINSTLRTFRSVLKSFLTSQQSNNKHFINATFDYNLNGDLNLQDSVFSYDDLHHLLHGELKDDLIAWKQRADTLSFNFYMSQKFIDSNRAWKQLEKLNQQQQFKVNAVNLVKQEQQNEFFSLIERYFNVKSVDQLMEESRSRSGMLRSPRPVIYVFPSGQGDSAYFSVDGYNMLVNGGYSRARPAFWNFVAKLKQIDSVLLTHSDSDSLGGLCSLFAKKVNTDSESNPAILSVLGNLVPSGSSSGEQTDSDFILECVEKLKYKVLPLFKTNDNLIANAALAKQAHNLSKYEHVNLYYKLGQGSLDLYVLSPLQSSPEFKEFCQQQSAHFARNQSLKQIYKNMPSSHLASAVCLLVWLPMHRQVDAQTPNQALRLLFTGHAPQNIILHALDKLKDFELLNTPVYKVRQQETSLQPQKKIVHSASSVIKTDASKTAADNNKPVVKQEPSSKPPVAAKPSTTASKPPTTTSSKPPTSSASSSAISSSAASTTKAKSGPGAAHDSSFTKKTESTSTTTSTVSKSLAHSKATTSSSNVRASISDTTATNKAATTSSSSKPAATSSTSNVTKSRQSTSGPSTTTASAASSAKPKEPVTSAAKKSTTTTTASSASKPSTNSSTTAAKKEGTTQAKKTLSLTIDNSKKTAGATTGSKAPAAAAASKTQTPADVETTAVVAPTAPVVDVTSAEGQVTEETVVVNSETVVTTIGIAPEAVLTATTESTQNDEAVVQEQVETTIPTAVTPTEQQEQQLNEQVVAEVTTPEVVEQIVAVEQQVDVKEEHVEVKEEVVDDGFVHVNENDVPEVEEQPQQQQQQTEVDVEVNLTNGHHHHSPLSSEALNDDLVCLDTNNHQSEAVEAVQVNGNHHDNLLDQNQENNLNSIPSSYNHHTNESPNLSPVKKEFPSQLLNGDDQIPAVSNINGLLIDVEEQKLINVENNLNHETNGSTNGVDLEIMSTNLTSKNGDVMTASFIEDPSNPDSNPFNTEPIVARQPANQLNDSQDLNRTHELFKDEEEEEEEGSSNGVEQQQQQNGNHHSNGLETNGHQVAEDEEEEAGEIIDERELVQQQNTNTNNNDSSFNTDKLIDGIEQMKIAAAQELENHTNGASTTATTNDSEPKSWNLLELPKPINPSDSKSNLAVAASNSVKKTNSSTPSSPAAPSKTPSEVAGKTSTTTASATSTTTTTKPVNIHPAYVELTYIPAHGNGQYVDVDFFKRVRAKYYVLSCLEPSEHVLNALLEAKENFWSGEDKNAQVNIVPTHETELLRKWFVQNEEKLAKLKIEILPGADMATLTMEDDPDSSCYAFKLEF